MLRLSSDPEFFIVVMPNKEDVLVLMGLSLMLFRLYNGRLQKDDYRLESQDEAFYSNKWYKVDRLYKQRDH